MYVPALYDTPSLACVWPARQPAVSSEKYTDALCGWSASSPRCVSQLQHSDDTTGCDGDAARKAATTPEDT